MTELEEPSGVRLGVILAVAGALMGSCDSDAPSTPPVEVHSNSADLDGLRRSLSVQYEAYAELLSMFSADGQARLFDSSVSLGQADSVELDQSWERLTRVAERLVAAEDDMLQADASISAKSRGATANPGTGGGDYGGVSQPLFGALKNFFFGWADGQRTAQRENIMKVVTAGGANVKQELFQLAQDLRDEGRLELGAPVDFGADADAFIAKLESGELDRKISMANLAKDAANNGGDYAATVADVGARPSLDTAYEQGVKGVAAGTELSLAASTAVLGPAFSKGVDLAKSGIETLDKLEQAATDPVSFLRDEAKSALEDRAKQFLGEKTQLSEAVIDQAVAHVGDSIQDFAQHVAVVQEADAENDPVDAAFDGDWGMGAVELQTTATIEQVLVQRTDPITSRTHLTIGPTNAQQGDVVLVPAGEQVTVIHVGGADEVGAQSEAITVEENTKVVVQVPQPASQDASTPDDFVDASTPSEPADASVPFEPVDGSSPSEPLDASTTAYDKTPWLMCGNQDSEGAFSNFACLAFSGTLEQLNATTEAARDALCMEANYTTFVWQYPEEVGDVYADDPARYCHEQCVAQQENVPFELLGTVVCDTPTQ
jgi:hypothetical protein